MKKKNHSKKNKKKKKKKSDQTRGNYYRVDETNFVSLLQLGIKKVTGVLHGHYLHQYELLRQGIGGIGKKLYEYKKNGKYRGYDKYTCVQKPLTGCGSHIIVNPDAPEYGCERHEIEIGRHRCTQVGPRMVPQPMLGRFPLSLNDVIFPGLLAIGNPNFLLQQFMNQHAQIQYPTPRLRRNNRKTENRTFTIEGVRPKIYKEPRTFDVFLFISEDIPNLTTIHHIEDNIIVRISSGSKECKLFNKSSDETPCIRHFGRCNKYKNANYMILMELPFELIDWNCSCSISVEIRCSSSNTLKASKDNVVQFQSSKMVIRRNFLKNVQMNPQQNPFFHQHINQPTPPPPPPIHNKMFMSNSENSDFSILDSPKISELPEIEIEGENSEMDDLFSEPNRNFDNTYTNDFTNEDLDDALSESEIPLIGEEYALGLKFDGDDVIIEEGDEKFSSFYPEPCEQNNQNLIVVGFYPESANIQSPGTKISVYVTALQNGVKVPILTSPQCENIVVHFGEKEARRVTSIQVIGVNDEDDPGLSKFFMNQKNFEFSSGFQDEQILFPTNTIIVETPVHNIGIVNISVSVSGFKRASSKEGFEFYSKSLKLGNFNNKFNLNYLGDDNNNENTKNESNSILDVNYGFINFEVDDVDHHEQQYDDGNNNEFYNSVSLNNPLLESFILRIFYLDNKKLCKRISRNGKFKKEISRVEIDFSKIKKEVLNKVLEEFKYLKSPSGFSLLHIIASSGFYYLVKKMIKIGYDVNALDNYCNTPIHWSEYFKDSLMSEILWICGADTSFKNVFGQTPYQFGLNLRFYYPLVNLEEYNNYYNEGGQRNSRILKTLFSIFEITEKDNIWKEFYVCYCNYDISKIIKLIENKFVKEYESKKIKISRNDFKNLLYYVIDPSIKKAEKFEDVLLFLLNHKIIDIGREEIINFFIFEIHRYSNNYSRIEHFLECFPESTCELLKLSFLHFGNSSDHDDIKLILKKSKKIYERFMIGEWYHRFLDSNENNYFSSENSENSKLVVSCILEFGSFEVFQDYCSASNSNFENIIKNILFPPLMDDIDDEEFNFSGIYLKFNKLIDLFVDFVEFKRFDCLKYVIEKFDLFRKKEEMQKLIFDRLLESSKKLKRLEILKYLIQRKVNYIISIQSKSFEEMKKQRIKQNEIMDIRRKRNLNMSDFKKSVESIFEIEGFTNEEIEIYHSNVCPYLEFMKLRMKQIESKEEENMKILFSKNYYPTQQKSDKIEKVRVGKKTQGKKPVISFSSLSPSFDEISGSRKRKKKKKVVVIPISPPDTPVLPQGKGNIPGGIEAIKSLLKNAAKTANKLSTDTFSPNNE